MNCAYRMRHLSGTKHWTIPEKNPIEGVKYSMWKFQGSIKKEVEFPGVFKKKLSGIFMGLGF